MPETLTAAAQKSGAPIRIEYAGGYASTNVRHVPYAELYRGHTAVYETPIQMIQRAARDEAAREAQTD